MTSVRPRWAWIKLTISQAITAFVVYAVRYLPAKVSHYQSHARLEADWHCMAITAEDGWSQVHVSGVVTANFFGCMSNPCTSGVALMPAAK
jgi:hypothetical protein